MISVEAARTRMLSALTPTAHEVVAIGEAAGRFLAAPVLARRSQPALAQSAMDGYAVRGADVAQVPARLRVIGVAPAGNIFAGRVAASQAVRIFTGGAVPDDADTIIIQENTKADGDHVVVNVAGVPGKHIRRAGLDFSSGDILLSPPRILSPRDVALAAAGDNTKMSVFRAPRVAILATGDEIVRPGLARSDSDVIGSSGYALSAYVRGWGGEPIDLGIARDDADDIIAHVRQAPPFDLLVTLGGASVGDHDIVKPSLEKMGFKLDFWKIAMRPGKPLSFGGLGDSHVIGLPGNPVSALVCAVLFVGPAIRALSGMGASAPVTERAVLGAELPLNDGREDYIRATISRDADGGLTATPFPVQDSSMMRTLAAADALIVRAPHAPAAAIGDAVKVIRL